MSLYDLDINLELKFYPNWNSCFHKRTGGEFQER